MITFIASMIMQEADKTLDKGQDKYRAYFVKTRLYLKQKDAVDAILMQDGYADIIVSE